MDFALTPEQEAIRDNVTRLCEGFDAAYWLARDRDGAFPEDVVSQEKTRLSIEKPPS